MAKRLTIEEVKVLLALTEEKWRPMEAFYSFQAISQRTNLERSEVRRACRKLKRKGLAEFKKGLWSMDGGGPCGSGYGVTFFGLELQRQWEGLEERVCTVQV